MVGALEMGAETNPIRSRLKTTPLPHSKVQALTWTKARKSFTGQIRELNFSCLVCDRRI